MSEKVIIPKEVARAIEEIRQEGWSTLRIANALVHGEGEYQGTAIGILRHWVYISAEDKEDAIMHALVNGYDIEQTPEEKLRGYYSEITSRMYGTFAPRIEEAAEVRGIEKTLDILGIQIDGINA